MKDLHLETEALIMLADDLSRVLKPPFWRVRQRWHWKRHQQPHDILSAIRSALRGEYAPLRTYGVDISATVVDTFDGDRGAAIIESLISRVLYGDET